MFRGSKDGFIGLGVMDKPMAMTPVRGGHTLRVYDHHDFNIRERGAREASLIIMVGGTAGVVKLLIAAEHLTN